MFTNLLNIPLLPLQQMEQM